MSDDANECEDNKSPSRRRSSAYGSQSASECDDCHSRKRRRSMEENQLLLAKGVEFLREKQVFEDFDVAEVVFRKLLDPSTIPIGRESEIPHYEKISKRLITLMREGGETHLQSIPVDVHKFSTDEFDGYLRENVVFLKYENILIQRHQLSGLCYMHGPAALQYYLISMNSGTASKMIDIVEFIKNHFTPAELRRHLLEDRGGNSLELLKVITGKTGADVLSGQISDVVANYNQYGPALVSQFCVYPDFLMDGKFHYHGKPEGESCGHHAMVLVGYREHGGRVYCLLQNWWKGKQFVEVDTTYLGACGATLTYMRDKLTSIEFTSNTGMYFEAEAIDKEESFIAEMQEC